jgi:predicted RNA-binding Zn-ribbon protein involved in translation (DUF1610 family)
MESPMKPGGHLKTNAAGKPTAVEYACPACGLQLESTPDEAGEDFPCPTCGTPLTVPCKIDVQQWRAKEADRQRAAATAQSAERARAADLARAHADTASWMVVASRVVEFLGVLYALAGVLALIVGAFVLIDPGGATAREQRTSLSGALLVTWGLVGILTGVVIIGFGSGMRMVAFIGRDVRAMRDAGGSGGGE